MSRRQARRLVAQVAATFVVAVTLTAIGVLPLWIVAALLLWLPDSFALAVRRCLSRRGRRLHRALWNSHWWCKR